MKLLIVDNHDSFTYNLVQLIKQSGRCTFDIIKNDQINLGKVEEFDKILFTPGPGLPSDFPAMFEILKKYEQSKSILGVCLGHQAIAEFYGGTLINSSTIVHGISKEIKIIETDKLFKNLPPNFSAGLYHSWYVSNEQFPDPLKITSISNDGKIMSFAHKQYDICGVQFHPESIMTIHGKQIINNWLENFNG